MVFLVFTLLLSGALTIFDHITVQSVVKHSPTILASTPNQSSLDDTLTVDKQTTQPLSQQTNKAHASNTASTTKSSLPATSNIKPRQHSTIQSPSPNSATALQRQPPSINRNQNNNLENNNNLPIFTVGDIVGRVFSDDGKPLSDIKLSATPYDIAVGQSQHANTPLATSTNASGVYRFNAVAKASYRVCTENNTQFTQSCTNVLPPQKTADLRVQTLSKIITVAGLVSDTDGIPLEHVDVRINVTGSTAVKTGQDGRYQLAFRISHQAQPTIHFSLPNYTRVSQPVTITDQTGSTENIINVSLTPNHSGLTIQGKIIDRQGQAIAGQRIRLRSARNPKLTTPFAVSNHQGLFTLKNVIPADDYQPRVITSADYQYNAPDNPQKINVTDSTTTLTLELERLQLNYQTMTLFLADQTHQPLSGLTLNLIYQGKQLERAITSENGEIRFNKAPDGALMLSAVSLNLRISNLSRDQHNGMTVLVNKGNHDARITVTNETNQAVVCRRATISWTRLQNGLTVHTSRNVQSDSHGIIYTSDLGSGQHVLKLSQCAGYQNHTQTLTLGTSSDFSVTLRSAPAS